MLTTPHCFHLHQRGLKRHKKDDDSGSAAKDNNQLDEDDTMQDVENAYHVDLLQFLWDPIIYSQLGLSGPPHTITHSSLQDKLDSMQIVT